MAGAWSYQLAQCQGPTSSCKCVPLMGPVLGFLSLQLLVCQVMSHYNKGSSMVWVNVKICCDFVVKLQNCSPLISIYLFIDYQLSEVAPVRLYVMLIAVSPCILRTHMQTHTHTHTHTPAEDPSVPAPSASTVPDSKCLCSCLNCYVLAAKMLLI